MLWWEREIYIKLLVDYEEQKKQKESLNNLEGFGL